MTTPNCVLSLKLHWQSYFYFRLCIPDIIWPGRVARQQGNKQTYNHIHVNILDPFLTTQPFFLGLFRRMLRVPTRVSGLSRSRLGPEFLLDVIQSEPGWQHQQPARDDPWRGGSGDLQQNGREDKQARRVPNHEVLEETVVEPWCCNYQ